MEGDAWDGAAWPVFEQEGEMEIVRTMDLDGCYWAHWRKDSEKLRVMNHQ